MDGKQIPNDEARRPGRYFQSVEELFGRVEESGGPMAGAEIEFGVPAPGDGSDVDRRDFMKLVGTTFAAASVTAGCARRPVEKIIPYVYKPEEITPGAATWYATTCGACPAGCGLMVKSRDGRPIKIEGNPQHPLNQGGVCAIGQGSLIDLYDGDRLRKPRVKGKEVDWKAFMKAASEGLKPYEKDGKGLALVTGPIPGPAGFAVIDAFVAKYPGARHVVFEAPGYGAIVDAHEATHGVSAVPVYDFEAARVIISFGADFLGSWLAPAPFARGWSQNRKLDDNRRTLSTVVQIETRMTSTGASADHRVRILPSEQRGLVFALAAELGVEVPAAEASRTKLIKAVAARLRAAKGRSLVVADSADVAVQAAVNGINHALGNYGRTVNVLYSLGGKRRSDAEVDRLLADLESGVLTGLVLAEVNPVYASPRGAQWKAALTEAKVSVALSQRLDETAKLCKLQGAASHYLESWGDNEALPGQLGMRQPLVRELFGTRQWEAVLLGLSGVTKPFREWMKEVYKTDVLPRATGARSLDALWDKAVHDGVYALAPGIPGQVEIDKPNPVHPAWEAGMMTIDAKKASLATLTGRKQAKEREALQAEIDAALAKLGPEPPQTVKGKEIGLIQPEMPTLSKAGLAKAVATPAAKAGAGRFELLTYVKAGHPASGTNNPFLHELPGPISRVSWDNYACLSPKTGAALGVGDRDLVSVQSGGKTLVLPVVLSPGLHDGALAVALGYGRTDAGAVGNGVGKDAWPLALPGARAEVGKTGERDEYLGFLQRHHSAEHRDIVRETTLEQWTREPRAGNEAIPEALRRKGGPRSEPATPIEGRSVWGDPHDYSKGYKWQMVVDLNACTGCGACVVACSLENNVPMVGKKEVARFRDMHWMRIDRYYAEKPENEPPEGEYDWDPTGPDLLAIAENPDVVFEPVMCQHCEHAGCETVCPVIATMHTSEGLNAMAYNRCIGTRYCANNCAYKVRRFNWFNYPEDTEMWGKRDPAMVRLALNPDIVKRSRGVMEKCSMCVQRIQQGKSDAIRMGLSTLPDGMVQTACAQTCPSRAIRFGNVNDAKSEVRQGWDDPRRYRMLEEVGTRPAVGYLTRVRNPLQVAGAAPRNPGRKEG